MQNVVGRIITIALFVVMAIMHLVRALKADNPKDKRSRFIAMGFILLAAAAWGCSFIL